MGWSLPKPRTLNNGAVIARKAIPADVRDDYQRLYGVGWEERWRAAPGTPQRERKHLCAEWVAEIERRIEALRAAKRGDGINLNFKDAVALAGDWYKWFVARHEDNPGDPEGWEIAAWNVINDMLDYAPDEVRKDGMAAHEGWERDPKVQAHIRPIVADRGGTAQFLAGRGIALTNDARTLFLDCALDNLIAAFSLLERRAERDYTPDELPKQFPKFSSPAKRNADTQSAWKLFESWVAAKQPAASTVTRWRSVFEDLEAKFSGPNAEPLTEDTAHTWSRSKITQDRSARTVKATWLKAANTVYAWAKSERLVPHNPFTAVKVPVPRKIKNRENDAFTSEEWRTILRASTAIKSTTSPLNAAKRWLPWLCAYSGARAGEITQLRGIDIERRGDFHVMKFKPEAGTMKTGEARTVPLHTHLIEQGFLDFVHKRGKGPLFYKNDNTDNQAADDPMRPKRPPAVKVGIQVGKWVRALGVSDREVQPNHAWRDTFKQIAERSGISERVHDAITGHAPTTAGRTYGQATVEDMAAALCKFPRYEV